MNELQRKKIAAKPGSDMKNTQTNSYGMSICSIFNINSISYHRELYRMENYSSVVEELNTYNLFWIIRISYLE